MKRREFMKSVLAVGASSMWNPLHAHSQQPTHIPSGSDLDVKRVLVMFKCHFDAGFIDTQAAVVHRYFSEFFPRAIQTAEDMRQSGSHLYVWTTGSWLLYQYLEQAAPPDRKRMEQAIVRGDIAWHAIPFSWQSELMDASLISGSIGLSHSLDRRFGRKTTGSKMTDVPGHTRGLIAPLAAEGVTFLDIGVNDASTPAEVPPLFAWRDTGGAMLVVMYHHGYGGVVPVPGSDLAVAIVVRGDNSGPHTPKEINSTYADLARRFPNAAIIASSLTDIANAVEPYRNKLPVVTQEIGDTWIYGVASDPLKVARYREVARLRQSWIAQGNLHAGDATDVAFLRDFLLEAEHTWGTDTKTWLDFEHYGPNSLAQMLDTKNYKVVEFSWTEKRQDLFNAIAALPAPLRTQATSAVQNMAVKQPQMLGHAMHSLGNEIETTHFILGLDAQTGAIRRLRNKKTGREWASADHPLALFSYQTLSQEDYSRFLANYIISTADWAMKDFGKPNIERFGAQSRTLLPELHELQVGKDANGHRMLARMEMKSAGADQTGHSSFPARLYCELLLPDAEPAIHINFYWFGKPASRLPEALWFTFNPAVTDQHGWMMEKSDQDVSPFDVVPSGGRHMHAVSKGFHYRDAEGLFDVETLDAPLIALGERSPLNFSKAQPELSSGIHCSLFNNAWGTNYVQWFGEDMRFRFILRA